MSRKNTIKEAIFLAKQHKTITAEKTMAMLYALADKFLNGAELEEDKVRSLIEKLESEAE